MTEGLEGLGEVYNHGPGQRVKRLGTVDRHECDSAGFAVYEYEIFRRGLVAGHLGSKDVDVLVENDQLRFGIGLEGSDENGYLNASFLRWNAWMGYR